MDLSGQLIQGTIGTFEVKEIAPPVESGQLLTNSGASNTTDWVDTNADGLADGWSLNVTPLTSIVVEGSNRYQKFTLDSSGFDGIRQLAVMTSGRFYKIRCYIRATSGMLLRLHDGTGILTTFTGTGSFELVDVVVESTGTNIIIQGNNGTIGHSAEIDWITIEEVPSGYPLLDKGDTYLECTSNGQMGDFQTHAYGTWQFKHKKGSGELRLYFISSLPRGGYGSTEGWFLYVTSGEAISVYRSNPNDQLFITDIDYIENDVWYEYRITRTKDNSMLIEMRGGEWADWHTVVPLTGSNPFVDANHTKSTYIAIDDDSGSAIADFKHSNIVKQ